ncbi:MAG: hypothetical protein QF570_19825 [Myxococcota bacterium]|nr:hypothetical protein [Myxococcota bacterium]
MPWSLPSRCAASLVFSLAMLAAPSAFASDCDADTARYCPKLNSNSPTLELVGCMEPHRNRLSKQCVKEVRAHPLLGPYGQYVSGRDRKPQSSKAKLAKAAS